MLEGLCSLVEEKRKQRQQLQNAKQITKQEWTNLNQSQ